jgi:ferric-dicitrate binding protein FerR (iron transport regulator)
MSPIYKIIARHFTGQTTPEEEKLVQAFKSENAKEYHALEKLWFSKLSQVKDYDQEAAWNKVEQKASGKGSLRQMYRRIASIAAVFLLLVFATFYFINIKNDQVWELVQNDSESSIEIALPDGSMAYLNSSASINYPVFFDESHRYIKMNGEVFFEVVADSLRPFQITTAHAEVVVLGTSFNVNSKEDQTEVSVATGKVKVQSTVEQKSTILAEGETARVTNTSLVKNTTEDLNFSAWKTGIFKFDNEPIAEAIIDLNTYYQDLLVLSNTDVDCNISTTFDNLELTDVIQIIGVTCNLKTREIEGIYELY